MSLIVFNLINLICLASNALKLFNIAGSDAPFRAVLKALLNQVLLKPALVKMAAHSIVELYGKRACVADSFW